MPNSTTPIIKLNNLFNLGHSEPTGKLKQKKLQGGIRISPKFFNVMNNIVKDNEVR